MARPISDEELQLKKRARRRLVGAIVLVSAVAVILPMVLDSEPRPVTQNVDIQIPSPDSGEFKPKAPTAVSNAADATPIKGMPPAPKGESVAAAPKPDAAPAGREAAGDAAAATASAKVEAKPDAAKREPSSAPNESPDAPKPTAKAPADPPKARATDGASPSGSYVVQVAALADTSRVKQLQKQMAGAGVRTYTEVVTTKAGEVTRVRAGPYATREAAESARTQLKKAGLDGKVVSK